MSDTSDVGSGFEEFVDVIARLRAPGGCPWDREQTHASIARNMIEEAYEAVDAIEHNDTDALREELGDVLLQVVLHSQIASEAGAFSIEDVVADVRDKMIRRHPHVFGTEAALIASHLTPEQHAQIEATKTAGQVLNLWDQIKLIEKQQKAERKVEGLLDGIPQALPALMQAQDISRKAVSAGFEWPDVASVWEQVASEIEEYRAEDEGSPHAAEEFGDVLFSLVNVARKEGIDAESALRATCRKFRTRWAIMEQSARTAKRQLFECSTEELEKLWQAAKAASQDFKEVRQ
ncbi:MAG: nucleoside triphosphate pyrophosphohydrolase [Coriobacteriales bacterium]|jgi:tetrapyrrole methylase family protein/MazG family protein|nr:nucleoside triphosphate pyrophosphohydrolase [Coriobacteriales bacterium]